MEDKNQLGISVNPLEAEEEEIYFVEENFWSEKKKEKVSRHKKSTLIVVKDLERKNGMGSQGRKLEKKKDKKIFSYKVDGN